MSIFYNSDNVLNEQAPTNMSALTAPNLKRNFLDTLIEVLENEKTETDLLLPYQSPSIRRFINNQYLYPPKKNHKEEYTTEEALNIFWRILIVNLRRKDHASWEYIMSLLIPKKIKDPWTQLSRRRLVNIMEKL